MILKRKVLDQHQLEAVAAAAREVVGHFCYPTGTGKTTAEAHIIANHIKTKRLQAGDHTGVYVVLAPRIMLAQQLFSEIWLEVVLGMGIDCHFFSLHSGEAVTLAKVAEKLAKKKVVDARVHSDVDVSDQDDEADWKQVRDELTSMGIDTTRNFKASTKGADLIKAAEIAKSQNVPLVVCATYHSSHKLEKLPTDLLIADEGHNTVSLEFSGTHDLPATKRFYFTATLKYTDAGENGFGMQNETLFGKLLGSLSPAEAVSRKLIVRPRIHYVNTDLSVVKGAEHEADSKAIEACFEQHAKMVKSGAKLLVAVRGTKHLKQVLELTQNFKRLRATRPNLMLFSIISGKDEAKVNGVVVKREEFMRQLKGLGDGQEALILHYDILSEGIDVPGITGVMPLRPLGTSKFLQMLGRATRLHPKDRENTEADVSKPDWKDWFIKPYAWLVVPCYSSTGNENAAAAERYVSQIRTFGWIPGQDEFISEAFGEGDPESRDSLTKSGKKLPATVQFIGNIVQRLEDRERADAAYARAVLMTNDELIAGL